MRFFRRAILTTTALVAISAAAPATSAPEIFLSASYATKFVGKTDQSVLNMLISEYKRDKKTFEAAIEYIDLNRPDIKSEYLSKTRAIYTSQTPSAAAPAAAGSATTVAGASPFALAAVGVSAGAATWLFTQQADDKEDDDESDPSPAPAPTPDPIEGDENSFKTSEYNINYGLTVIGAASKYATGAQGQGVKISVLDTGIDVNNSEFEGKIDTENSYSYIGAENDYSDTGMHGTHVSGIIAANKDNFGAHGVAFGSELVVFKGIPSSDAETVNRNDFWADAINRSVNAGASVMNNSWGFVRYTEDGLDTEVVPITAFSTRQSLMNYLGSAHYNAFSNAVANDLLIVAAAGNDGADQVSVNAGIPVLWDEFDGYFIAVAATNPDNTIASYSNRCGVAMDFCLAAPGTQVTSVANGGGLATFSGTSMAAPHVTGAAAVLKSMSPELTAPEISQILFDTAYDLGAPGVDDIYGHGLLNLSEAQSPQGALVVYQGTDTRGGKALLSETGIKASTPLAGALSAALAEKEIMVGDKYDRGYYLNADALVTTPVSGIPNYHPVKTSKVGTDFELLSSDTGRAISYLGRGLTYTIKQGTVEADSEVAATSPLSFIEQGYGAEYSYNLGSGISIEAELSGSNTKNPYHSASFGFTAHADNASLGTTFGTINEYGSVLGTDFLGAAGDDGEAKTAYIQFRGDYDISPSTTFSFIGTRSETNFKQSGLITGGNDLGGTAGRIALSQRGLFGTEGTLTASVSTPLQVTSGQLSVDLPGQRVAATGGVKSTSLTREQSDIKIETASRPYDLGLSYKNESNQDRFNLMLNAGYRSNGIESHPFAGFDIKLNF